MPAHVQLTWVNHFFFASLLVWFFAWQESSQPLPAKYGPLQVTKAIYTQPRTPPPVFDPEVTDANWDSLEPNTFEFQP